MATAEYEIRGLYRRYSIPALQNSPATRVRRSAWAREGAIAAVALRNLHFRAVTYIGNSQVTSIVSVSSSAVTYMNSQGTSIVSVSSSAVTYIVNSQVTSIVSVSSSAVTYTVNSQVTSIVSVSSSAVTYIVNSQVTSIVSVSSSAVTYTVNSQVTSIVSVSSSAVTYTVNSQVTSIVSVSSSAVTYTVNSQVTSIVSVSSSAVDADVFRTRSSDRKWVGGPLNEADRRAALPLLAHSSQQPWSVPSSRLSSLPCRCTAPFTASPTFTLLTLRIPEVNSTASVCRRCTKRKVLINKI
ncbi:hypothetical protein J6590_025599 [Homalodisca vitripennis]|nr:hypothetical protein J6590_025599 [Homalodisca vitripennis]